MRAVAACLCLVLAIAAGDARAEPSVIAGTRLALDLPRGFVPSTEFTGFVGKAAGATVIGLQLPANSFAAMRSSLTDPTTWKNRGQLLVDVKSLPGFPHEHVLIESQRKVGQGTAQIWTLAFSHPELTGIVTVNIVQRPQPGLTPEAAKAMLKTLRVVPGSAASQAAKLPFSVDVPDRFTHRQAVSPQRLFLKETPPPGVPNDPTAVVSLESNSAVAPRDRDTFLRLRLYALQSIRVETLEEPRATTVAGLPALEVIGVGTSPKREPIKLYAVAVFGPQQTYMILAFADPNRFTLAIDDMKALAKSFKPL